MVLRKPYASGALFPFLIEGPKSRSPPTPRIRDAVTVNYHRKLGNSPKLFFQTSRKSPKKRTNLLPSFFVLLPPFPSLLSPYPLPPSFFFLSVSKHRRILRFLFRFFDPLFIFHLLLNHELFMYYRYISLIW